MKYNQSINDKTHLENKMQQDALYNEVNMANKHATKTAKRASDLANKRLNRIVEGNANSDALRKELDMAKDRFMSLQKEILKLQKKLQKEMEVISLLKIRVSELQHECIEATEELEVCIYLLRLYFQHYHLNFYFYICQLKNTRPVILKKEPAPSGGQQWGPQSIQMILELLSH